MAGRRQQGRDFGSPIVLRILLLVSLSLQAAYLLFAPSGWGTQMSIDHLLFHLPFVLGILACWKRARSEAADGGAWVALAVALTLFLAGSLYAVYLTPDLQLDPSFADLLWLSSYAALYLAIGLFTRTRVDEFHASAWFDGAIAGFGAMAVVAAFVLGDVMHVTGGSLTVVAVNLAYPIADLTLGLLLGIVGLAVTSIDRAWWLIGSGLLLFFLGDVAYLYLVTAQTFVGLGIFELTWPACATLMGVAATLTPVPIRRPASSTYRYLVPSSFTFLALALLVSGQRHNLPNAAVALAVATVALAAVRLALTIRELRALAEARSEARTDFLTGLANRRHLFERLSAEMDIGNRTSLLIVDLDGFKEVNDSLGHAIGDELLQLVSERISVMVAPPALLARLGGDEFAVVLPGDGADEAERVARNLQGQLRAPFRLVGMAVAVRASVGVATAPQHGVTPDRILACADIALYQAKKNGLGLAAFQEDSSNPSRQRIALMSAIADALERGEFDVVYQPQVQLPSRNLVGVEALVRWNHPDRGIVYPDEFIPLVHQLGRATDLTHHVLTQATAEVARLKRLGHSLRLSVNVSRRDIADSTLPSVVSELESAHGLQAGWLALEITEDEVITDLVRGSNTLNQLRSKGVAISVDDFGTGHSSLAYLRDLPLDELKLDRSFLIGTPGDLHNAAIVRATIELAHSLGLPVVAEGIEDHCALEWLEESGCDLGQGYYIGRPMTAPALEQWLREGELAPAVLPRSRGASNLDEGGLPDSVGGQ